MADATAHYAERPLWAGALRLSPTFPPSSSAPVLLAGRPDIRGDLDVAGSDLGELRSHD